MKRALCTFLAAALIFGAAAIFATRDSRAIPLLSKEPVCRAFSPSTGKCLVFVYPGNVAAPKRLETIRKNIYWKSPTRAKIPPIDPPFQTG